MTQTLARRLTLTDAIFIGLGSMIGAGIFSALAPAAGAAGSAVALLAGLVIAGCIAYCNATASAQLAAVYPQAGGTYVYGRKQLGPWAGYLAGWSFISGKIASAAAMATTFALYVAPPEWARAVAVLAVAVLVAVNLRGVTKTARLTQVLVVIALAALALVVAAAWTMPTAAPLLGWDSVGAGGTGDAGGTADVGVGSGFGTGTGREAGSDPLGGSGPLAAVLGALQAAGFLFFAFAGYARIATMGEEVRRPERTIPRAISVALAVTLVLYAVVTVSCLHALGVAGLAGARAPLDEVVRLAAGDAWHILVTIGAAAATLGALLGLVTGLGRTTLAMARERDLPGWLAAVDERHGVPMRAELVIGGIVMPLAATLDLRGMIGFSSFGVLVYYFVANLSAWTQTPDQRRYPRILQVVGMAGCAVLAALLPWTSVLAGCAVLGVGLLARPVRMRLMGFGGQRSG